jgi:hypothetical protein
MPTLNRDQLDPAFDDAAAGLDPVTAAKLAEEAPNIARAAEAAEAAARAAAREAATAAAADGGGTSTDDGATERRPVGEASSSTPPTEAAPDEYYAAKEAEQAANVAAAAGATDAEGAGGSTPADEGPTAADRPFEAPPGWAHAADRLPSQLAEQARVPLAAGASNGASNGSNELGQAPDRPDVVDEQVEDDDPASGAQGGDPTGMPAGNGFDHDAPASAVGHGHGHSADASHGHEPEDDGDDPGAAPGE